MVSRDTVALSPRASVRASTRRVARLALETRLAAIWQLASEAISARELRAFDCIMAHGMTVHHEFYFGGLI